MPQPTYDIYQQKIIDHYRQPTHQGVIDQPQFQADQENTLCGDKVSINLSLDTQHQIHHIAWQGQGCAISLAATDILSEHITGQSLDHIKTLTDQQWLDILGLELRPSRHKCALLGLNCLRRAIG